MKSLEEMNLLDNFLVTTALDHKKYGREITGIILEPILGRSIKIKDIVVEKPIFPTDPHKRGVRLDAYVEEETADVKQGTIYDLEPDRKENERNWLPYRVRYNHSMLDKKLLESGKKYKELPNVWVIFITSFDPFLKNRMIYTIQNHCKELPDMDYNDGATTLFLYPDGTEGEFTKELQDLLRYMNHPTQENACSEVLKKLHSYITDIKADPETKEAFMTLEEYVDGYVEEAVEEAVKEAVEEATAEANQRADNAEKRADEAQQKASVAEQKASAAEQKASVAEQKINEAECTILKLQEENRILREKLKS